MFNAMEMSDRASNDTIDLEKEEEVMLRNLEAET